MSIHMGSTTSVDAIKGDDDAEFGKHVEVCAFLHP